MAEKAVTHITKVVIKSIRAIVTIVVKYNQTCFCSYSLDGPCLSCENDVAGFDPTTDSIAQGNCGHSYHHHCIEDWKANSNSNGVTLCPTCGIKWDLFMYKQLALRGRKKKN